MLKLSIMEFVVCLTEVIDLMSEVVKDHHKRVASGVYHLADIMGIEGIEKRDLVIAAALHDIGALTQEARDKSILYFEDIFNHAEKGYKLLSVFKPFHNIANIVRYHHTLWNYGEGKTPNGRPIPMESQIILLADRLSIMLNPGNDVLDQAGPILAEIAQHAGPIYSPQLIDTFVEELAYKDFFWMDIMYPGFYTEVMEEMKMYDIMMLDGDVDGMLSLISFIIDFRSEFTARHSRGVSVVAERLAMLLGFSEEACYHMWVAGMLHDIGKLAVPTEIIEKPGPLTPQERNIIRTHAYYTEVMVSRLINVEWIRQWAAQHHESLDGNGYPFGYDSSDLSLGSKVMRVADVFVAVTEDRPYRSGMSIEKALSVLEDEVRNNKMDGRIVQVLHENINDINTLRAQEDMKVIETYRDFISS